jgi:phage shock protein A
MIKEVIWDMDTQYLQVKTQVAISIADLHMLEKKRKENQESMDEWFRKPEKSVEKQQDDLARIALERYRSFQRTAQSYSEQVSDQQTQVEGLKTALQNLEQKLVEAKSKRNLQVSMSRSSLRKWRRTRKSERLVADIKGRRTLNP